MSFIEKDDFNEVVLKPELGAFKTGFKVIKNPTEQKLTKALNTLKKMVIKDYYFNNSYQV